MPYTAQDTIHAWHAHVYFDAHTVEKARALCQEAGRRFAVSVGRVHEKPVGPHPCWSCQLAFGPDLFDQVVPWLAINRAGLTVLVHPETGDAIADHRDHALWMGRIETLDLSVLR